MSGNSGDFKAQVRTQFNAIVPDYDNGPGCFAHFGRRLVAAADLAPGQRVLDVASGRGAVLFAASDVVGSAGDVVGIDFAEQMVHAASAEAVRRGLTADIQVMDAENISFADATFDRVLCGFGIMFFPNQERALGEFRRVLKADGKVAVSTWQVSQTSAFEPVFKEMGVNVPPNPGWITDPDALAKLLGRVGFTNVCVEAESHSFRYKDIEEYWQQARGTGFRRILDGLDQVQANRARALLSERVGPNQSLDGVDLACTALIATAIR